jgi:cytochrome P450
MFQEEMMVLLRELKQRGAPDPDDQDIATQLCRVLQEHPDIPEARVLSEIGILFVEGFETTGGCLVSACKCLSTMFHLQACWTVGRGDGFCLFVHDCWQSQAAQCPMKCACIC